MKVIINEKLVKRQAAIGKGASLIGMGALLAGLVVSYRWPNLLTVSFGCLIVGFLLASIGTYNMNRWVKEPRADQALTKALKGLDNKHFLYHYTPLATHLLLAPSGLFVFTVKDHYGYIDVESTEGKGTTFTLYFPATREKMARGKELVSIEDYMGSGESILVVDDVQEQREIASATLDQLGYSVTTVTCGEEAIEYLKSNSADLIILI